MLGTIEGNKGGNLSVLTEIDSNKSTLLGDIMLNYFEIIYYFFFENIKRELNNDNEMYNELIRSNNEKYFKQAIDHLHQCFIEQKEEKKDNNLDNIKKSDYREYWNKGTGSMTKAEKAEYERYKQNPKKYCKNGNDWETQYYLDHPDVAKKMAANYRKKAQTQTMLNGVLSSLTFGLYNRVDKEKTNYWNNIMTQIKTKETGLDKDVNSYNSKVRRLKELVKKYEKSGLLSIGILFFINSFKVSNPFSLFAFISK